METQGAAPGRRADGEATHTAILEAAMRMASVDGLSGLTIGGLARELGISKSGVYAHFRSKERLQFETLAAAGEVFQREVMEPALGAPEGRAQIEALCEAFLGYVERKVFPGGCFFAGLLGEFDGKPGPIHDQLATDQRNWLELLETMAREAQAKGEFDPAADVQQLAFEVHAAMELANYHYVLYSDPAVIERGRAAIKRALDRAG